MADFRYNNRGSDRNSGGRDFNRGGGRSGGFRSSGGGFRGGSSRGSSEMFPAVCDNCQKNCEVPFQPTSGKPIYCRDCFDKKPERSFERRDSRPDFNRAPRQDFNRPQGEFSKPQIYPERSLN